MCVRSGWLIKTNCEKEIGSIGHKATNVNKRRSPRQPPQRHQFMCNSPSSDRSARLDSHEKYNLHDVYCSVFKNHDHITFNFQTLFHNLKSTVVTRVSANDAMGKRTYS